MATDAIKLIDLAEHRRMGRMPRIVTRPVEQTLALDTFNAYYARYRRAFSDAGNDPARSFDIALNVLGVSYDVSAADIEKIPAKGPLVVVSNHPFGGLEGVVLGALLLRVRPDVKIMGNYFLERIAGIKDFIAPVDPFGTKKSVSANVKGLKESLRHLRGGGVLIVFPSGEVSSFSLKNGRVSDPPWSGHVGGLIRRTGAAALPVFFPGQNSLLFQFLGLVHPRLRTAFLPRELVNKTSTRISLYIGGPIAARKTRQIESDDGAVEYLRTATYLLRYRNRDEKSPATAFVPLRSEKKGGSFATPTVAPVDAASMEAEIAELPADLCLAESNELSVYVAEANQIPNLLREIGRLREITFRQVGEGTGKAADLDFFDNHYKHLFIWNTEKKELVGAYRLGRADRIIEKFGPAGLYTHQLFRFRPGFTDRIGNAVEFGRSFIRSEYQKKFNSLMLLWKGIGEFVARNPEYHILFGAVSISRDYHAVSQNLMVRFLKETTRDSTMAGLVSPRRPYRSRRIAGVSPRVFRETIRDIDSVSLLVSEIEKDGKGVPVLLRQYLKLDARILCFNVDGNFSDVIDGLLMVDLLKTETRLLKKFMGARGFEGFARFHGLGDSAGRQRNSSSRNGSGTGSL